MRKIFVLLHQLLSHEFVKFILNVIDFLYCLWQQICGLSQLCYRLLQKTEISKNAGNFSYQHLQFIYHRTNYFHLFWSTYDHIQPSSPTCNYWSWDECYVWSFLFKELHCNWQFLKDYHPISQWNDYTWTKHMNRFTDPEQSMHKPCNTYQFGAANWKSCCFYNVQYGTYN